MFSLGIQKSASMIRFWRSMPVTGPAFKSMIIAMPQLDPGAES